MNILFCDRCGTHSNEINDILIQTIYISTGESHSDKIRVIDLCVDCKYNLLAFLNPTHTPKINRCLIQE